MTPPSLTVSPAAFFRPDAVAVAIFAPPGIGLERRPVNPGRAKPGRSRRVKENRRGEAAVVGW